MGNAANNIEAKETEDDPRDSIWSLASLIKFCLWFWWHWSHFSVHWSVVYLTQHSLPAPLTTEHANKNSAKEPEGKQTDKKDTNSSNPGNTEKKNKKNPKHQRGAETGVGVAAGCSGDWKRRRRVQTHGHSWSTDTDRFALTVTVPVPLAARLCHLEMLKQSLQEGRERRSRWRLARFTFTLMLGSN